MSSQGEVQSNRISVHVKRRKGGTRLLPRLQQMGAPGEDTAGPLSTSPEDGSHQGPNRPSMSDSQPPHCEKSVSAV